MPDDPETDGTKKEGVFFILKILAILILPAVAYGVMCKLLSHGMDMPFGTVWKEGILWIASVVSAFLAYGSKSVSKVITKSWKMRTLILFVLSILIAGYLYGAGKLFELLGLIRLSQQ